ncbi:Alpha/Beta hydrolase protein [Amylocystis lapponica]|nr:Alpha/Beta hydrolase protein [Amylocystis lapponica]
MPIAPVSKDASLYYEDSGVPTGSTTYTTLVLIHGAVFHGGTFRRMIPFAAQHNLRLVIPNLRDYPGSTPFSQEELDALASHGRETQRDAIKAYGEEIAAFFVWFIQSEHIPPATRSSDPATSRHGGVVLLGWSAGNIATLSMLSHSTKFPELTKTLLSTHLRSLIVFDATLHALGFRPPETLYSPLRDTTIPLAERTAISGPWLSAYYSNTAPHPSRTYVAAAPPVLPHRTPSVELMAQAGALAEITDPGVVARSHRHFLEIDPLVFRSNTVGTISRRALPPPDVPALDMDMCVVWCAHSFGDAVYAAWELERICERSYEYDRTFKPNVKPAASRVRFLQMEDANHFVLWEEPERALAFIASMI